MGFIHHPNAKISIPPSKCHFVTGTWADAAGAVSGTIVKAKATGDETALVNIPIALPFSSKKLTGAYLKSIIIWFDVTTSNLDALAAVINLVTNGADGSVPSVAAQTFTYDTGHDDAGERIDQDEHKMTLTITTPFWIGNNESVLVALSVDAALNSVFHLRHAQANFTFRM